MKRLPEALTPYSRTREFSETSVPVEEVVLTPQRTGIVEPEVRHQVQPRGRVRFCVEFLTEQAGG